MPHFLEKYSFMDWSMFKYLNNSSYFLQFLSIINMSSPVLSLVLPLLFLIFPFLILKFQGIPITFTTYLDVLKTIAKNHFIGKMMNVNKYDFSTMIYLLFTLGFYCLQIYQNINACMRTERCWASKNWYLHQKLKVKSAKKTSWDGEINT